MITTDAMNELCTLMKSGQFTAEVFDGWVSQHYAMPGNGGSGAVLEPRCVESARQHVRAFDAYLTQRRVVDCRFTRAIIGLRNVFALYSGMSTPVTVILGVGPVAQKPTRSAKVDTFADLFCELLRVPEADGQLSF